ncbi:hypothetical protein [Streptomyces sp. NPDC058678]|uniref:hypothetical protein n=1 Tax=Streptomyces sp. NPDC058678 TaxID=3346595 RepID=UPI00365FCA60
MAAAGTAALESPDAADAVVRARALVLFLFDVAVAAVAPFVDGDQGVMTGVGMGVVPLGAGVSLLRTRG